MLSNKEIYSQALEQLTKIFPDEFIIEPYQDVKYGTSKICTFKNSVKVISLISEVDERRVLMMHEKSENVYILKTLLLKRDIDKFFMEVKHYQLSNKLKIFKKEIYTKTLEKLTKIFSNQLPIKKFEDTGDGEIEICMINGYTISLSPFKNGTLNLVMYNKKASRFHLLVEIKSTDDIDVFVEEVENYPLYRVRKKEYDIISNMMPNSKHPGIS